MENRKIDMHLSGVAETLIIPLWARAEESRRADGIIHDEKSIEMIERLDYDASKFSGQRLTQVGCAVRAKLFDEETLRFLAEYPQAIVLNIGCGLDTRGERLRNAGATAWYDLDLPKVIELRKQFFTEDEYLHFIPKAFDDYTWLEAVKQRDLPVLIIAEGLFMFFREEQVKAFVHQVMNHFSQGRLLIESTSRMVLKMQKFMQHRATHQMKDKPLFQWATTLHAREMNHWDSRMRLVRVLNFTDYAPARRWGIARFLGLRYMNNKLLVLDF